MFSIDKWVKKPIVVDAVKLTRGDALAVAKWCKGLRHYDGDSFYIIIQTLEGAMRASEGDYIICGINGEFYPCKPDIFESTYERAMIQK